MASNWDDSDDDLDDSDDAAVILAHTVIRLNDDKERLEDTVKTLKDDKERLEDTVKTHKDKIRRLEAEGYGLRQEIVRLKALKCGFCSKKTECHEEENKKLKDTVKRLEGDKERLEDTVKRLEDTVKRLEGDKERLEDTVKRLEEERQRKKVYKQVLSDVSLDKLASRLDNNWRAFIIRLGVSNATIHQSEESYPHNARAQIWKSLIEWRKINKHVSPEGNVRKLIKVLQEDGIDRNDLVEELLEEYNLKQFESLNVY